MTVPYAFANLSGNIALAKLDSNFNTPITIGNTSVLLGNTITTLNNVTLANVTITSATAANVTLTTPLGVSSGGTGLANTGNSGNVLTSIGGVWVSNAVVASTSAGGSNTQVQYNSGGTLAGSANLVFDGANLGIGTSSPGYKLDVLGQIRQQQNSAAGFTTQTLENQASNGYAQFLFNVGANGANGQAQIGYTPGNYFAIGPVANDTTTSIVFRNNNGTERVRIDSSGNLLVGKQVATFNTDGVFLSNIGSNFSYTSATVIAVNRNGTDGNAVEFYKAGTLVGTISITGSATAYNTSSDYRLKENIQPMQNALAKVNALKPVTYNWKSDGSDGEGFIAHELSEVCPHAVTGEKDAVNEDGSIKSQGIDTSFLVATLTAALQEAHSLIKDLQTRVAQLEAK